MNKKGVLGVGFLLAILIIVGGLFVKLYILGKGDPNSTSKAEEQLELKSERDGFTFIARYQKENETEHVWEYKITGVLPSPCYQTEVKPIVLDSYPEQVSILLTITLPESDVNCIQVIDENFETKGEFKASDKAKISFVVDKDRKE